MSNSQNRDEVYNLTSPHSSNGVADSFRGTPDTRLTAFSPEDGSTKSQRTPHSTRGSTRDKRPIRINFGAPQLLNVNYREPLYALDSNVDRDPFVSNSRSKSKTGQMLSPTASCFAPSSATSATRASEPGLTYPRTNEDAESKGQISEKKTVLDTSPDVFAHKDLSTDTGISRCVIVETTTEGDGVECADVERYISVSLPSILIIFIALTVNRL